MWCIRRAGVSKPFVDENFDFFARRWRDRRSRRRGGSAALRATDRALGEAVGQDWVERNFPPAAKENMEKLVDALERALEQDIQQLPG